jgi:hypothetical protein
MEYSTQSSPSVGILTFMCLSDLYQASLAFEASSAWVCLFEDSSSDGRVGLRGIHKTTTCSREIRGVPRDT